MPKIDKLRMFPRYEALFYSAMILDIHKPELAKVCTKIKKNISRYQEVADHFKMPPEVVGVIHSLEGSLNFNTHLHNGDPLSRRTTHVPKGRPKNGTPPFSWEVSAIDALTGDGASNVETWDLPHTLYWIEGFNGWGYQLYHSKINSPYIWSFTNKYVRGKYDKDGHFNADLVSDQCGAAALLKTLGLFHKGDV